MLEVATIIDTEIESTTTKGTNAAKGVTGQVVGLMYLLECLRSQFLDPLGRGNIYLIGAVWTNATTYGVINTLVDCIVYIFTILQGLDVVGIYEDADGYDTTYWGTNCLILELPTHLEFSILGTLGTIIELFHC